MFIDDAPRIDLPKPADLPEAIGKAKEEGRQEERARCAAVAQCYVAPEERGGPPDTARRIANHIERRTTSPSPHP
jgi:hypothetical protein